MSKLPEIVPVTDLRHGAAEVLQRLRKSKAPLVITQRGRAAAVLLSIEAYEKSQHDMELLRLLVRGEKEIAKGEGHSLESVLEEADALLSDESY